MTLRTLVLYLIGNRAAILELAANRRVLWAGLVFVLSAGFAREYDGEDLLREPWYLLIPVGASLVASFLLFLVACGSVFLRREGRPPFFAAYRQFLTLFWLTAPLAWLYAIPFERFLSPGTATSANLWTLAFVAAWRVALMVRVVSVLTNRPVAPCLFLVMAFADAVALVAVSYIPKPVIAFMGGVRLTESEAAVQGATLIVGCLGGLSAPVWGIGALAMFFAVRAKWQVVPAPPEPAPVARGVWGLAASSLLVWLPILPFMQPEQQLRSQVERYMKAGRIAEALDLLSAHEPREFPPGWEPPPRIGYITEKPHILDVMEVVVSREVAPWVRAEFVEKLRRYLGDGLAFAYTPVREPELGRVVGLLQRLPEGPEIAYQHQGSIKSRLDYERVPAEERANLQAFLKLAEGYQPPKP